MENKMHEWLSWWSTTLPRSGPRVRVPSRALVEISIKLVSIFCFTEHFTLPCMISENNGDMFMNQLIKILTGILGVLAVLACLATIGVIGYSLSGGEGRKQQTTANQEQEPMQPDSEGELSGQQSPVPTQIPESEGEASGEQPEELANHVHDYKEEIEKKATCYQSGVLKYTCSCGDTYYVDVASTGHVADEWEVVRKPTSEKDGLRVKKCIYCDEIVAQETVAYEKPGSGQDGEEAHVHQYAVTVEREPSCVLAGLRKYTCSCGSFYTEKISALGHIATDWTTAEESTETTMGREQRTCTVCGVVLDSRPVEVLKPSASPTESPSATASPETTASPTASASQTATPSQTASPSPTASPTPTATPHSHNYASYVLVTPNCQEKGVRSFVCSCGSSYAEAIEKDSNNHSYKAVITRPSENAQGYTTYTCIRCGYSYVDNYVPATNA